MDFIPSQALNLNRAGFCYLDHRFAKDEMRKIDAWYSAQSHAYTKCSVNKSHHYYCCCERRYLI